MTTGRLPDRDVVLVGVGHTNAHVLKRWRMATVSGVRLTCISDFAVATYSGMLPGVLAGRYHPGDMTIDLVRLCAASGARLIIAPVQGVDSAGRVVHVEGRPPVPFDILSIGLGSTPSLEGVEVGPQARLVAIKPMQTLLARLDRALTDLRASYDGRLVRIVVAGGGAAGVEVALCVGAYVTPRVGRGVPVQVTIVTGGETLLQGHARRLVATAHHEARRRGIEVLTGRRIVGVHAGHCRLEDAQRLPADIVVWCTGAAAPAVLARTGLPLDARGFLLTDDTLRSASGEPVFAVGDSGTIADARTAKAGVYAVRQGPVLWENIVRQLRGRPLRRYRAQRQFLKLLDTGDGSAIAEWRGLAARARWAGLIKRAIDRRFISGYQDYRPMERPVPTETGAPPTTSPMRCLGCGGKVGGSTLSAALARLSVPDLPAVSVGLAHRGDAAVMTFAPGQPVIASIDAFAAPLDDPYLVGRVAALNALSDVLVVGGAPRAALASVVLPEGAARQQAELLFQVMAGAQRELAATGASLVGGHTIEGERLGVGFAIFGEQRVPRVRGKDGLRGGDALVLTRALGTGTLLAAHMRAMCEAAWYEPLLTSMLQGNAGAAGLADTFALRAVTDVTGFGLAGHLAEMLRASGASARVDLAAIPRLPGATELLAAGVESTAADANREHARPLVHTSAGADAPSLRILFDPQTGGGLLMAVPEQALASVLGRLIDTGHADAAVIGEVTGVGGTPELHVG